MTDLKIKPDTLIKKTVQRIQPENTIASRLSEAPQAGRELNAGEIVIDQDLQDRLRLDTLIPGCAL